MKHHDTKQNKTVSALNRRAVFFMPEIWILGACLFLVGQIIGQIKKGLKKSLVTICKSVENIGIEPMTF